MSEKRRGLGRGLGALIPAGPAVTEREHGDRPVDVFFPGPAAPNGRAPGSAFARTSVPPLPAGARSHVGADVSRETTSELSPPTTGADSDGDANRRDADRGDADRGEAAGLLPVPGAEFAELPLDSITPNPRQPRTVFDEDELDELAHSVREIGVLQPVVVRRLPVGGDEAPRFELVMGERRWRASQQAGLATVPAIIRDTADDDLLRDALLENLHRSQLNALEEAAAYAQLLEDFGCTHDDLARRIGRSRPQISNTIRLLRLPPLVQRRVAAGVLSAGHARALLGLDDGAAVERLAQRVVAEGLSVRATEEIVSLGGQPKQPARRAAGARTAPSPQLDEVAARLSDRFDTRVSIAMGRRKGRLTVEFASVDDLERILAVLEPAQDGAPTT